MIPSSAGGNAIKHGTIFYYNFKQYNVQNYKKLVSRGFIKYLIFYIKILLIITRYKHFSSFWYHKILFI